MSAKYAIIFYAYYIFIRAKTERQNRSMNRKNLTRLSSLLVVAVMVALLLASLLTPVMGAGSGTIGGINALNGINTNWQQYLDGSVVTKLPETVKSTDEISVIIKLDNPALLDAHEATDRTMSLAEFALTDEAEAVRKEILREKSEYLALLDERGIEYATGLTYDTVFAGFEIIIKASSFATATTLLGENGTAIVGEVYEVAETKLVNNKVDFYEDTGIFDSSDFPFDGSGMVIAVLDTGLDYTHSAFDPSRFTATELGLTKDEVAALLGNTDAASRYPGLSADDVYLNDKVPFSFDYADSDPDVYSMHNNHGTHVSGVIVGKDDVITGVAPNAQLVSMKIFSDTADSARTSWILAALEDCVTLGVDVINMSLGTACGFSREMDKEAVTGVYDRIRSTGISMVVAASNSFNSAYSSEKNGNLPLTSNPDSATVGSPSTYEGALSVASIAGEKTPYMLYNGKIVYFVEATNSSQKEKDFFDEILTPLGTDSVEIEYILIPGAGRPADYTGLDMTGKIALVRRGSNTFEEKANAAQAAGAAGIIVFNNVAGDIKMNAGVTKIPICSIGQDDGEMLAAAGSGVLKISRIQTSGPFISDFSSWGPTPDLGIKPEITAHGGNILSAVTANTGESGYDRLSGTSMACPNMAGAVALMRQYVKATFPEIREDEVEVTAMVNRLLMSTADIMLNKNGLPYAVRKQGAGLGNLDKASATTAYILTYDRLDGSVMDKTKLELGDDPERTGVYEMTFSVNNFGYYDLIYFVDAYVMTEGVSETKTHAGETTVTEEGYLLDGAKIEIISVSGGTQSGMKVTVPAGESTDVTVRITLSDADKKYIDDSFENGMYVEGFVRLEPVSGTDVGMSVPYLAFYGDWTEAPLFDLDYFETNKDELDDSIETLDKTLPDAYATRPVGGLYLDYISYLGSYYFVQDPQNEIISANRDYISLTNTGEALHSLVSVYAGLLRNAERIVVTITDDATGEVIFETVANDVRKSYGDGGPIYPANVEIEFDTLDYNLMNNSRYTVRLEGYLDYGDGGIETNEKNTFEFPITMDFQAPQVTGVEYYTEYDRDSEKMRLYAKVAIYDNHYAMSSQIGYISDNLDYDPTDPEDSPYIFNTFNSYMTPVYSERNSVSYVTYELTDYISDFKEKASVAELDGTSLRNSFVISCYDYALNESTFQIPLPDDITDFYFDGYELTLCRNEVFTLEPETYPGTEWTDFLVYGDYDASVVNVVGNKIVAVGKGTTDVTVRSLDESGRSVVAEQKLRIRVLDEGDPGFVYYDKPVADVFELRAYETLKAYYVVNTDERDIGSTGSITTFNGRYSLKLYPSESVRLIYELAEYFPSDTTVVFESSNENIVKIDGTGTVVAREEGYASVTVSVYLDGEPTYYSATVDIEVKDPYLTTGPSLTHYYGLGGTVEVPARLELTEIGQFAFSNYDWVEKGEDDEISEEEPTETKQWFLGEGTITKVVIPEGIKKIGAYAFASLTALEEVVLPSTLEAIEYGAFYNCVKLKRVVGLEHVQLINKHAFYNCPITGRIDLSSAYAVSDYAFAAPSNAALAEVVLPETLRSIGAYAFSGQNKLTRVTVNAASVKLGAYAFMNCTRLTSININTQVIPTGAFYGCLSLASITLGADVATVGEYAFYNTKLTAFTVADGNAVYRPQQSGAYLLSADGSTLLLVAPGVGSSFALNNPEVTRIGSGAFSASQTLKSVSIPSVTEVDSHAFAGCSVLESITLGTLTYVGSYAFADTAIKVLPDISALDEISDYAFAYTDLTEVTIPDGTVIGEAAFGECRSLERIHIGNNVIIGSSAFMVTPTIVYYDEYTPPSYDDGGRRVYYYEFESPLKELHIGEGAVIGTSAFYYATNLERVTLGDGAVIGDLAFYNACSLREIDLSAAVSIGSYAFSGDSWPTFTDKTFSDQYIKENYYVYKYFAPKLTSVDLSSATYIGERAFHYCESLVSVKLGEGVRSISTYAFANCSALKSINLEGVEYIDESAFAETALTEVSLDSIVTVGKYAFTTCESLTSVSLNPSCAEILEGAFASCTALRRVDNLRYISRIGAYAFAHTLLNNIDLTMASYVGDLAFMKQRFTIVRLTLGELLTEIGDNPFAMCIIDPECLTREVVVDSFNGTDLTEAVNTYEISENILVINGSLYARVPNGLELVFYTGDGARYEVEEGTVRISSYAFAGSTLEDIVLPESLRSIGHKAFYGVTNIDSVVFKSYSAPVLEEEYDQEYYMSYDNIPGSGSYGISEYDSKYPLSQNTVIKTGLGISPYYMWGITSRSSNYFYGASFVDYIGKGNKDIEMVRPVNGVGYDSFIYSQYFTDVQDGAAAPDEVTTLAIEAIEKLVGVRINLEHEQLVLEARAAYDRIATELQRAIVSERYDESGTSYTNILTSAERRIAALKGAAGESPDEPEDAPSTDEPENAPDNTVRNTVIVITALLLIAGVATVLIIARKRREGESEE